MCAGCDPESYTWPDVSSDGTAPTEYDWLTVETPFDWINPKWRETS